jgi:antitoxin CptB
MCRPVGDFHCYKSQCGKAPSRRSGLDVSCAPIMDIQRKRLLFRARHMGTNENDIFFGGFAEATLPELSEDQLNRFEKLLDVNDPDLFLWVTGAKPVPDQYDDDIMAMLKSFTLDHSHK